MVLPQELVENAGEPLVDTRGSESRACEYAKSQNRVRLPDAVREGGLSGCGVLT
jgi:hypothetical protein